MKRFFLRMAALALTLAMCVSLAACAKREKSGGLGSLRIEDTSATSKEDDDVGVLGEKDDAPKPAEDKAPKPAEDKEPDEDKPEETPAPTEAPAAPSQPDEKAPAPAPAPMQTEQYDKDGVKITIPAGWSVSCTPYDTGTGAKGVLLFVVDPQDANNQIFYASKLSPFFTSADAKTRFVQTMYAYGGNAVGSAYEWAPVLDALSAQDVIKNWGSLFTFMQADGTEKMTGGRFRNYALQEVLSSTAPESTQLGIISEVLAKVSIPGASEFYVLDYLNAFAEETGAAAMGLPKYYNSFNNLGICVSAGKYESYYPLMLECLRTLDTTEFDKAHN